MANTASGLPTLTSHGTERRRLLRNSIFLAASGGIHSSILDALPTKSSADTDATYLLELDEGGIRFGDFEEFIGFRRKLAAASLNPGLKAWMEDTHGDKRDHANPRDRRLWALLEVERGPHGRMIIALLDYLDGSNLDRGADSTRKQRFLDWISTFNPQTRDDFLMALPLYYRYLVLDGSPLPTVRAKSDPWLDSMFAGTRGMLFWRYQLVELLGVVGQMGQVPATTLAHRYLKRMPDAAKELDSYRYAGTDQSLLQIIEERVPNGGPSGRPDYLVAERLWRHYAASSHA